MKKIIILTVLFTLFLGSSAYSDINVRTKKDIKIEANNLGPIDPNSDTNW